MEAEAGAAAARTDKVAAATSSTSLYDNVTGTQPAHQAPPKRKFKTNAHHAGLSTFNTDVKAFHLLKGRQLANL